MQSNHDIVDMELLQLPEKPGAVVQFVRWVKRGPGFNVCQSRRRSQSQLTYIVEGRGRFQGEMELVELGPGSAYISYRKCPMRVTTDATAPQTVLAVGIAEDAVDAWVRDALGPAHAWNLTTSHEVQDVMQAMRREAARDRSCRGEICDAHFRLLVALIRQGREQGSGQCSGKYARFLECRTYIEQHHRRLQNVEQIAVDCGMTATHCCRLFRSSSIRRRWHTCRNARSRTRRICCWRRTGASRASASISVSPTSLPSAARSNGSRESRHQRIVIVNFRDDEEFGWILRFNRVYCCRRER